MKTLFNSLAITSVVLIGLSSLTSHAANKESHQPLIQQQKRVAAFYFAPELASEGSQFSASSLTITNYKTTKPQASNGCKAVPKKNELYELGAIFNDKLQMLLSYLNTDNEDKGLKIVEKTTDPRVVSFKKNNHS